MRERYLIEASGDELWPFHLAMVGPDGQSRGAFGNFDTLDEAKRIAQDGATDGSDPVTLIWKDPPLAWQPDAICVSQYLEPMYPDLPTD